MKRMKNFMKNHVKSMQGLAALSLVFAAASRYPFCAYIFHEPEVPGEMDKLW